MNIVNLVGRLAKDPVARDRSDTRITELILVTERPVIRDGKVQKDPGTRPSASKRSMPIILRANSTKRCRGCSRARPVPRTS